VFITKYYQSDEINEDGQDIQNAWKKYKLHTRYYSGNLKGRNQLEIYTYGRILLRRILTI
jgi:hypothetical protein